MEETARKKRREVGLGPNIRANEQKCPRFETAAIGNKRLAVQLKGQNEGGRKAVSPLIRNHIIFLGGGRGGRKRGNTYPFV